VSFLISPISPNVGQAFILGGLWACDGLQRVDGLVLYRLVSFPVGHVYRAEADTGENCTVIDSGADNKKHDQWSLGLGIDRGTCWKNEYPEDKHGARRRSIRIKPPAEGKEDDVTHCLRMYRDKDTTCAGESYDEMTFGQDRTSRVPGHTVGVMRLMRYSRPTNLLHFRSFR